MHSSDASGIFSNAIELLRSTYSQTAMPVIAAGYRPAYAYAAPSHIPLSSRLRSATFWLALLALMSISARGTAADDVYLQGNFTGEEMLKYCKVASDDSVRDFERGVCTGFIDGFAAGHHAAELWHAFHHRGENIDKIFGYLCVPKDTNRTALVTMFVRYLQAHPDKLGWGAGLLLESALSEAYPCDDRK